MEVRAAPRGGGRRCCCALVGLLVGNYAAGLRRIYAAPPVIRPVRRYVTYYAA